VTNIAITGERPTPDLWRTVGKLLRLRWVIFINGFRRARLRGKIGTIVLALLVVGALAFAFWISWLLLRLLRSPRLAEFTGDLTAILEAVPTLVVSAAFLGILITSFGVLLQALYLAGDMDFLLSRPVPIRAVFVTKLLQAILPNFSLVLLFGLPVLYGLGVSSGYNLLYYPLVLVVLALLSLAAAGLASLLVMAVVRVFPARRVAEILGFLVAILSFTCSQSGQFANYANVSGDQATQVLNQAARLNVSWSPLTWAGRSLVEIGEGNWLVGFGLLLVTVVLTGGIFTISLVTAERLYYSGWASVQVSTRPKRSARRAARSAGRETVQPGFFSRILPHPVRGILVKDFLVLRRDLRSMSQLVTPLILGIVYAFMLIRRGGEPPAGRGEAPQAFMDALRGLMVYANVGISLFVGWSLLSRLAAMAFSQEGKSYWVLKASPVRVKDLLAAKFLVAYLPTLGLCWGFMLVISLLQRASFTAQTYSLAAVALILAGATGINLAFGVIGANFDWEDPRRISQGSAGCLGAIASMVYLLLSLAIFFGPLLLVNALRSLQVFGYTAGLALGSAACLACAIVPLLLVSKRIRRLMEE
jgi:hypothetical protein